MPFLDAILAQDPNARSRRNALQCRPGPTAARWRPRGQGLVGARHGLALVSGAFGDVTTRGEFSMAVILAQRDRERR